MLRRLTPRVIMQFNTWRVASSKSLQRLVLLLLLLKILKKEKSEWLMLRRLTPRVIIQFNTWRVASSKQRVANPKVQYHLFHLSQMPKFVVLKKTYHNVTKLSKMLIIYLGIKTAGWLCTAEEQWTLVSDRVRPGTIEVVRHQQDIVHHPAKHFVTHRTKCLPTFWLLFLFPNSFFWTEVSACFAVSSMES